MLYGMGDGADKILEICKQKDITISGVFASDDFVRGQSFRDFKVQTLRQIEDEYPEFVVVQAFGTSLPEVMENIYDINRRHKLFIPDLPISGNQLFDREFLNNNFDRIVETRRMFADTESRKTFDDIILYKITGELRYLVGHPVTREAMFKELFDFSEHEIYIDAGAYQGDTVEEFIHVVNGKYQKILAFEPSKRNFKRLQRNTQSLREVDIYNIGIWNEKEMMYFPHKAGRGSKAVDGEPNTLMNSLDNILVIVPTYIKYDVEGAEARALVGSQNIIEKFRPKLMVSVYHRTEDLFLLPELVRKLRPDYKLYLRRNPGVPAWDINLIAL